MEFETEITLNHRYRQVNVVADWVLSQEGHEGYWEFAISCSSSGFDLTPYVTREDTQRLTRKAQQLAQESWNDAYDWRQDAQRLYA